MELLLNLLWLTLALPALWLWRRANRSSDARPFGSLRCLLVLSCLLTLLFPVISATDDLHPMRAEMEESSLSKRMLRSAADHRAPVRMSADTPALWLAGKFLVLPHREVGGKIFLPAVVRLQPIPHGAIYGRSPPFALPS